LLIFKIKTILKDCLLWYIKDATRYGEASRDQSGDTQTNNFWVAEAKILKLQLLTEMCNKNLIMYGKHGNK
jgi:hypothetical protein